MEIDSTAVLTGDLIGSRKQPPEIVDSAIAEISEIVKAFSAPDFGAYTDRHRGDGWQVVLSDPAYAVKLALHIQCGLRTQLPQISTRIAIGFGTATFDPTNFSDAYGTAFINSGDALTDMPKDQNIHIDEKLSHSSTGLTTLLDLSFQSWTKAQCEAVFYKTSKPFTSITDEEIAEVLGLTRQAVQARLSSIGYNKIDRALRSIETEIGKRY